MVQVAKQLQWVMNGRPSQIRTADILIKVRRDNQASLHPDMFGTGARIRTQNDEFGARSDSHFTTPIICWCAERDSNGEPLDSKSSTSNQFG
jgi:hypothetical protein